MLNIELLFAYFLFFISENVSSNNNQVEQTNASGDADAYMTDDEEGNDDSDAYISSTTSPGIVSRLFYLVSTGFS